VTDEQAERLITTLQAFLVEVHALRKELSRHLENLTIVSSHVA